MFKCFNGIYWICDINNRFSHFNVQNGFEVISRQNQLNMTNFHVARSVIEEQQYGIRNMPENLLKPSYTYLKIFEFGKKNV